MVKLNSFQALKKACDDSDVKFVSGYSGYISSAFLKEFDNETQALNETLAVEMAHIHSYLGKRSIVIMKNAGINQAALPFRNTCDLGVSAGMVVVITDDINAEMSENRQDSRVYSELGKTLLLEPKSPAEIYSMAREAFTLSELFKLPVIIRITNSLNKPKLFEEVKRSKQEKKNIKRAKRDKLLWVLSPLTAGSLNKLHGKKYKKVEAYSEKSKFNEMKINGGKGCIYSQALSPREKTLIKKYKSVMEIGTYPVPNKKIEQFVEQTEKFDLIDAIDSGMSELSHQVSVALENITTKRIIDRKYGFEGVPKIKKSAFDYDSLFRMIKKRKADIVVGDFGSYTFLKESPIEYALHYGGGVGSAVGAALAEEKKIYALIGDGGFSTGVEGLIEAKRKKVNINIVIIENHGIAQEEKLNLDIEKLAKANGASYVKRVHINCLGNSDFDEIENHDGIAVLLVNYTNKSKI